MDELEIEIINWEKYNGRHDVANPTWFRMQNNLFFDPKMGQWTCGEVAMWVFILSLASQKGSSLLQVQVRFIVKYGPSRIQGRLKVLRRLEQKGLLRLSSRNVDVTRTYATDTTDRQTDRTDRHVPLVDLEYRDLKGKTSEELIARIEAKLDNAEVGK